MDSGRMKTMVLTVSIFDSLHLALCTYTLYWYLITNHANPSAVAYANWSLLVQVHGNGVPTLIVQLFYVRRVRLMGGSIFLVALICIMSATCFAFSIVFTVTGHKLKEFARFGEMTWITSLGLGSGVIADILIAASMCWSLYHSRTGVKRSVHRLGVVPVIEGSELKKTPVDRTDSIIHTLMQYSINSGVLTSVVATSMIFAFAFMPTAFIWLGIYFILGKCYVNSFLAILNSRGSLRKRAVADPNTLIHLSFLREMDTAAAPDVSSAPLAFKDPSSSRLSPDIFPKRPPLSVSVSTTTISKIDPAAPSSTLLRRPPLAVRRHASTASCPSPLIDASPLEFAPVHPSSASLASSLATSRVRHDMV
ncbi:hypothetical protein OF83DRAFT_805420 [Amylostereum chailletii]|nr:hypothetical protein OF83DRAFT_805420 [Amylostereum chailletii]